MTIIHYIINMKVHPNEILLYFDPGRSVSKKTLAYASSISNSINMVEYGMEQFTPTSWRQILGMLDMEPKQLVNKAKPYYQKNIRGRNFSMDDWINILTHHPDLIRGTIAIRGDRAVFVDNPTDVLRLK